MAVIFFPFILNTVLESSHNPVEYLVLRNVFRKVTVDFPEKQICELISFFRLSDICRWVKPRGAIALFYYKINSFNQLNNLFVKKFFFLKTKKFIYFCYTRSVFLLSIVWQFIIGLWKVALSSENFYLGYQKSYISSKIIHCLC